MVRVKAQPSKKMPSDAFLTKAKEKRKKNDKSVETAVKKRHWKPGTVVNRDIKKQQRGDGKGFDKSTFFRVCKGIAQTMVEDLTAKAKERNQEGGELVSMLEISSERPFEAVTQGTHYSEITRWSSDAKKALLQATEEYVTEMFVRTKKALNHRGIEKMEIRPKDLMFAIEMMNPNTARTASYDQEDINRAMKSEERKKKKDKKNSNKADSEDQATITPADLPSQEDNEDCLSD
jgi:histone H3/H4